MEMRILNKRSFANAHAKRWIRYLVPCAVIVFFLVFSFAVSSENTVFGPKTYTRTSGPFNVFQENFNIADINTSFTVIVQNGDVAGGRLSSAKIVLNGTEIIKPSDFNQQVQEIRKTVVLRENNTLRVELQAKPGSFITISIVRDPTPVLSITSPLNGTVFRSQPITVEGTIDIASAQVTVNGVPAAVNGGRFIAQNVPLIRDGMNTITAIGTAPGGNTGQASVMVILDTMAPTIVIDSPSNGFVTPDNTISVSGMVSDVITPNPTVFVNDVPATVTNGTFLAMGVPLNMGDNQITATARDGVGNQSTASVTVNRADLPGLRLRIISGQAQTALIKSSLPEPLRVKLIDAADNAVSNREIIFQVSRGDGSLRNSPPLPGQAGQRTLIVNTDGNGEAAVRFDLGSRTGPGNNRVQASVVGALSPVEFSATATSGAPDRIAIVPMSNQQTGVVNQPLGMPLACVVLDASGNPVAGVPVTFQVTEGGGNLGGNPSFVEATGADGVAHALLTLGPEPGTQNNVVAAAFQGQPDPPVTFAASGRVPGLLGNTTFSGLVLDNGDLPLRNARAVIAGTDRSAVTDATGRFLITNVPPGAQRLLIDGSGIVDSQGRIFPGLEFDLNVIGGVENSLPMPIYLPPLSTDPQSVARITGPVTTPVTLQIPGIPQATLTLLAGTIVSNHDGPASAGNPITVRLSRVNNDRVPMPPPNGSVFTLAGTVQPSGTHFSIPARVCSPNTGMPPGAQVDIFSFDHDVGQFLSIGFATVSEDGATVCSNPGFGISKAGWFGATPPPPPTTETKNCRVTVAASPTKAGIGKQVTFTATTDPAGRSVTFGGDRGDNPVQSGNTLTTTYSTTGRKTVTARCEQSTGSASVEVHAVTKVTLDKPAGRTSFCIGEKGDFTAHLSTPLSGVPVTFEVIDLANNSVFSSATRTTNAQGQATITLEATTVGRYNIQARSGMENPVPFYGPVQVVRLLEAQAKRNDESDDVFDKKPGRFAVGDQINARAKLDPDMAAGDPIKWELRQTGFFSDTVKARGMGNSFTNQIVDARGTWKIIFYCDSNGNGQFDDPFFGETEPNVQTDNFEVQDIVVINLTVVRHVDVPFTNADADALFADSNIRLRKRDRLDDVRSAVELRRNGNVSTFGTTGSPPGTPPSIIVTQADQNAVFAVSGNIKVVAAINFCGSALAANGCTLTGTRNEIVRSGVGGSTWAHEFGHAQGLPDRMDLNHRIMWFQGNPAKNTVDESEADSYRQP